MSRKASAACLWAGACMVLAAFVYAFGGVSAAINFFQTDAAWKIVMIFAYMSFGYCSYRLLRDIDANIEAFIPGILGTLFLMHAALVGWHSFFVTGWSPDGRFPLQISGLGAFFIIASTTVLAICVVRHFFPGRPTKTIVYFHILGQAWIHGAAYLVVSLLSRQFLPTPTP